MTYRTTLLLCFLTVFALVGCAKDNKPADDSKTDPASQATPIASILESSVPLLSPLGTPLLLPFGSPGDTDSEEQSLVRAYITENIEALASIDPDTDKVFSVTAVDFIGKDRAVVEYENGQAAATVVAQYAVHEDKVTITSFEAEQE